MNKYLLSVIALAGAVMFQASGAYAAPIYIGLQEDGYLGGAITQETESGTGSASISNVVYGASSPLGLFEVSATALGIGSPGLTEPDLFSNSLTITGSNPGTISIYISELNQNPTNFGDFYSALGVSALPAGDTVVESTYVTECTPINSACSASLAFAKGTLLATNTFTSTGSVLDFTAPPLDFTSDYVITEEYTVTLGSANYTTPASASVDLSVPEPASIAILGAGLLAFGAVKRRRSKKA